MKNNKIYINIAWYFVVVLGVLITLIPIIWVTVSSFRPNEIIFRYAVPFSYKTFLPTHFTFDAYKEIFQLGFSRTLLNTFFVTAMVVLGGIIINSMSGFTFAKLNFPGKNMLFVICLVGFMVPFRAIALPLFIIIKSLNWNNSFQALILPAMSNGIVILLFRQFFMGIPDDLMDSAKIDGASYWKIYWKIFLPMSKPAMISAGLILFLEQWLSFLWPLIANPDENYQMIQVAIAKFATEHATIWNQQFAATVITMVIPVTILMFLQKQYIRGVTGSEIKG